MPTSLLCQKRSSGQQCVTIEVQATILRRPKGLFDSVQQLATSFELALKQTDFRERVKSRECILTNRKNSHSALEMLGSPVEFAVHIKEVSQIPKSGTDDRSNAGLFRQFQSTTSMRKSLFKVAPRYSERDM